MKYPIKTLFLMPGETRRNRNAKEWMIHALWMSLLFQCSFSIENCLSQARLDKIYTMSGIGFSVPLGSTANYFKPKFSTVLGFNVGVGKKHLFFYPQIGLQAYSFNELIATSEYAYTLQRGRSTTYFLNLALGYRKIIDKFAGYGFAGGGGGIVLTPQVAVDAVTRHARLGKKSNKMSTMEAGAGMEYRLGNIGIFVEGSYLYGGEKIQNRKFNSIPLFIGIKPNLNKLFNNKND